MEAVKERVVEELEEEEQRPSLTMQVSVETDNAGNGVNDHLEALNNVTESLNTDLDVNLESSISVVSKGSNVDIMASSSKISSAVPSLLPSFNKKPIEEELGDTSSSARPKEWKRKKWELDLDEVYVKPGKHEFYCPTCDACITKVIVCSSKEETGPENSQDHQTKPVLCSSCFGFLTPLGEWLSRCCSGNGNVGTAQSENQDGLGSSSTGAPTSITPPNQESHTSTIGKVPSVCGTLTICLPSVTTTVEAGGDNLLEATTSGAEKITGSFADPSSSTPKTGVYASIVDETPSLIRIGMAILPSENPKPSEPGGDGSLQEIVVHGGESASGTLEGMTKVPVGKLPRTEHVTSAAEAKAGSGSRGVDKWEILKSIVYGGLAESITSLSVVASAAGADTATLNIIALSLANLVGGLFVLGQNLWELRKDQPGEASNHTNARVDRYQELLGEKNHFALHVILAVLSFLFFGLIPPVVYGFTFIKSDNRDYKLAAVAAASILCVLLLATGKALIQKPQKFQNYAIIIMQYVVIAVLASGVSFVAGDLFEQLLEKLSWFSSGMTATEPFAQVGSGWHSWSSN